MNSRCCAGSWNSEWSLGLDDASIERSRLQQEQAKAAWELLNQKGERKPSIEECVMALVAAVYIPHLL